MSEPILYLDRSVIRSPDLARLRESVADLTEFGREREPRLLFYGFEIDEQTATMRVVAVHPDSESLGMHLDIGGPEFRRVGAFIDLTPPFRAQAANSAPLFFEVDGHPNAEGYRLIARVLGEESPHMIMGRVSHTVSLRAAFPMC